MLFTNCNASCFFKSIYLNKTVSKSLSY